MTNLNAVIPILMHLFIFLLKNRTICTKRQVLWAAVKPNASQWDATLCHDVGFPTVYRRIYRRKFLTLPNQTSRYIRKCIRIGYNDPFNTIKVMSSRSVYLTKLLLHRLNLWMNSCTYMQTWTVSIQHIYLRGEYQFLTLIQLMN